MTAPIASSVFALVILAATAPCSAQDSNRGALERILAELKTIRERIDAAEKRLESIEKRRSSGESPRIPDREPPARGGASLYRDLHLPPNPTLDQAREYIREIKKRNAVKSGWYYLDPEARLMAKVGRKNLGAILEVLDNDPETYFDLHAVKAVKKIARDADSGIVIEKLPSCFALAEVILHKGWEGRARDVLLEGLSNPGPGLPQDWIHALTRLRDPETYGALLDYFRSGWNFGMVYAYISEIEDLPSDDLDAAVAEVWKKISKGDESNMYMMDSTALIAVRHGHIDAIGQILEFLLRKENQYMFEEDPRDILLSLIPFKGTNDEIKTWFEANRARLVYDRKTRKYMLNER